MSDNRRYADHSDLELERIIADITKDSNIPNSLVEIVLREVGSYIIERFNINLRRFSPIVIITILLYLLYGNANISNSINLSSLDWSNASDLINLTELSKSEEGRETIKELLSEFIKDPKLAELFLSSFIKYIYEGGYEGGNFSTINYSLDNGLYVYGQYGFEQITVDKAIELLQQFPSESLMSIRPYEDLPQPQNFLSDLELLGYDVLPLKAYILPNMKIVSVRIYRYTKELSLLNSDKQPIDLGEFGLQSTDSNGETTLRYFQFSINGKDIEYGEEPLLTSIPKDAMDTILEKQRGV
jgi:hypothetical protein